MQYKGLKMMKRMAALAVSAAIMLTDIGVYAEDHSRTSADYVYEQENAADAGMPGFEEKADTHEVQLSEQSGVEAGTQEMSTEQTTEAAQTQASEVIETQTGESMETQTSSHEDTTPPESEEAKTEESSQQTSEEESSGTSETQTETASETQTDTQEEKPEVQFKYRSDGNNDAIKNMPISISVKSPVIIEAAPTVNLPAGANVKVQWASSNPEYVTVSARTDILGSGVAALEGLRPTSSLDSSVKITCVLSYKEEGRDKRITGILEVNVKPLPESVSIRLGTNDVTGKKVIYDIGTKKFIAIDNNKLPEPVDSFSAAVYPAGANQRVIWKSSNTSVMRFNDESIGSVAGMGAGEAAVTATAADNGNGSASKPAAGSVTVRARRVIANLSFKIKMTDKNGAELEPDEKGRIELTSGAGIYIEPVYAPADATEKQISWTNGNKNAVDIKSDGNNGLKVTARNVAAETEVTLKAETTDMSDILREVKLVVKPKVERIKICRVNEENNVGDSLSGKSIGVDLDDPNCPRVYILRAINEPENASRKVSWEIGSNKVADLERIDANTCKVTAKAKGTVDIKAVALDGSRTSALVTLNVVSLVQEVVIRGGGTVMKGKSIRLAADALPGSVGNVKFKWESLAPDFAAVNPNTGEVTGRKCGIAIITATAQDGSAKKASHTIQVTDPTEQFDITDKDNKIITGKIIGIDPDSELPIYKAAVKILPETACQDVEWESSNEKIATVQMIGNAAVITAKAIGQAVITAKAVDGSGKTASISVNVNTLSKSVKITGNHYLASGMRMQLKAEVGDRDAANKSVIWESDAPRIADVDKAGRVTATGRDGKAVITARAADGSGAFAEHDIYVRNGNCQVYITCDKYKINNNVMEVDLSGAKTISLDMLADLSGYTPELSAGKKVPYDIIWSTSAKSIAAVEADKDDPGIGHVTIYKGGTVKITAASAEGYKSSETITINVKNDDPYVSITGSSHRLANGKKMKLSTGGVPVEWSSDDSRIAKVDSRGYVTADRSKSGTVNITAKAVEGTCSNTYSIEVGAAAKSIELTLNDEPLAANAKIGVDIIRGYKGKNILKLAAKLNFSDNSSEPDSKSVTWKSSNNAVAAIDEEGNVELKKVGNATFTAAAADGTNKNARVTFIVDKQLTEITPLGSSTVYVGLRKSLQLSISSKPIAAAKRKVVWESNNPGAVSVGRNNGKITGKISGASAVITAMAADDNAVKCTFTVYVEAPVNRVEIAAVRDEAETADSIYGIDISGKTVKPLELKANLYKKENGREMTCEGKAVIWSSSNKEIAAVDENGRVTGLKSGEAVITAMAADGSKKAGKVKVYCGKLITQIKDVEPYNFSSGIELKLKSKAKRTFELADKLKALPVTATKQEFIYVSEDKKVAAVDARGRVAAKRKGSTYIIVTPKDGSGVINDTIRRIPVTVVE